MKISRKQLKSLIREAIFPSVRPYGDIESFSDDLEKAQASEDFEERIKDLASSENPENVDMGDELARALGYEGKYSKDSESYEEERRDDLVKYYLRKYFPDDMVLVYGHQTGGVNNFGFWDASSLTRIDWDEHGQVYVIKGKKDYIINNRRIKIFSLEIMNNAEKVDGDIFSFRNSAYWEDYYEAIERVIRNIIEMSKKTIVFSDQIQALAIGDVFYEEDEILPADWQLDEPYASLEEEGKLEIVEDRVILYAR